MTDTTKTRPLEDVTPCAKCDSTEHSTLGHYDGGESPAGHYDGGVITQGHYDGGSAPKN